jgi:hypothetical protein
VRENEAEPRGDAVSYVTTDEAIGAHLMVVKPVPSLNGSVRTSSPSFLGPMRIACPATRPRE